MRRETVTVGHKSLSYLISDPPEPAVRQRPYQHCRVSPRLSAAERDVGADPCRDARWMARGRARSPLGSRRRHVRSRRRRCRSARPSRRHACGRRRVLDGRIRALRDVEERAALHQRGRPCLDAPWRRQRRGPQEPPEDDRAGRPRRGRGDRGADGAEAARRDDAARSARPGDTRAEAHHGEHAAIGSRPPSPR